MEGQPPPPPPPGAPPPPPNVPPPPPPGQPAPYAGGYAGGDVPQGNSGKAVASLVLGIAGLVVCPLVCSVLAIVFGRQAKAEIEANPAIGGGGMAQAGFVLGIVGLVLSALFLVIVLISAAAV